MAWRGYVTYDEEGGGPPAGGVSGDRTATVVDRALRGACELEEGLGVHLSPFLFFPDQQNHFIYGSCKERRGGLDSRPNGIDGCRARVAFGKLHAGMHSAVPAESLQESSLIAARKGGKGV